MITIRIETPSDYAAVERLTFAAFETMNLPGRTHTSEHFLVSLLRSDPWFIPELDFAAEVDGEIVGSIFYSHSKIVRPDGSETGTITFGPVSVAPKLHGKGVGSALIRHSLERARQMDLRAVLIMGHPGYYPRFGFTGAANFGLTLANGTRHDAFMALELVPGTLTLAGGRWQYAKAFDASENDREAFEAYHRRFLSNFPKTKDNRRIDKNGRVRYNAIESTNKKMWKNLLEDKNENYTLFEFQWELRGSGCVL